MAAVDQPRLPISLVATVRNEAATLAGWLASIEAQSRLPDEVVLVDGGSSDGTAAMLRRWGEGQPFPVHVHEAPGANISHGRNLAIELAAGPIIAVTDAGTSLTPRWLEALTAPFAGADAPDVVAGVFRGQAEGAFQTAMSATVLPLPEEVSEGRFLPSSRSVAFLKQAWADVGGYPEWAIYCEDLLFDMALLAAGKRMVLAREALVHFAPRRSLPAFWRQYRNYAMGDGQTNLFLKRHLARYGTYFGLLPALALLATRAPRWSLLAGLLGAAVYLRHPYARLLKLTAGWSLKPRLRAAAWVPVIRVWGDFAKMAGYPLGLWRGYRLRRLNATYKAGRMARVSPTAFRVSPNSAVEDRQ
ncbi:MAG: glycosyltransferase [Anaerolineae bacterium]